MGEMGQPEWDDPALDAGVMVRGALWLLQEVGVGNVFTKADIRTAFPDAAQADRRIRDLRDYGWVLHTRADDAALQLEQTRLVAAGAEVWDSQARRAASPNKGISSKLRDEVMSRDNYVCIACGVSGGEEYPDDVTQTAVLSVVKRAGTDAPDSWATLCKRCKSGGAARVDLQRTVKAAQSLNTAERRDFLGWVSAGRRGVAPAELLWSLYLRLPEEDRADLLSQVRRDVLE